LLPSPHERNDDRRSGATLPAPFCGASPGDALRVVAATSCASHRLISIRVRDRGSTTMRVNVKGATLTPIIRRAWCGSA
jgi:hypothetical protein